MAPSDYLVIPFGADGCGIFGEIIWAANKLGRYAPRQYFGIYFTVGEDKGRAPGLTGGRSLYIDTICSARKCALQTRKFLKFVFATQSSH